MPCLAKTSRLAAKLYLEGLLKLIFGDVSTAVLVKELESLEHILLLFKLAQIHSCRQELSIVNTACNRNVKPCFQSELCLLAMQITAAWLYERALNPKCRSSSQHSWQWKVGTKVNHCIAVCWHQSQMCRT